MATRTFLNEPELEEARKLLLPPTHVPDGDERNPADSEAKRFSAWLGDRLLKRLSAHPLWNDCQAVLLGSWARGELSPKSDIDLLFVGPEEKVKTLARDFSAEGIKLRYRVPLDPTDWTKGVAPFDVLALLSARALGPEVVARLQQQVAKISLKGFRKTALSAMREERKQRARRLDSIASFLEPNIKYGHGGLRDLEQALVVRDLLYPEKFVDTAHAAEVFSYYKNFFLLVRQRLHLGEGLNDVLVATEQYPIAKWLGYAGSREFMREMQKGLARVSFYADWVVEMALSSPARLKSVNRPPLRTASDLFSAFNRDSSILMQNRVRLAIDKAFIGKAISGAPMGRKLTQVIDPKADEARLVAVFRSHLIDHCVSDFRRIIGHVQHDQYHRYSVDAHILQVLRELNRLAHHPHRAGRLRKWVERLSAAEWRILAFAALYHDLAKGREGDHSEEGVELATKDFKKMRLPKALAGEVCWLIREHLSMSIAAFRENPAEPGTWRKLREKGVQGRRIALLAIFTMVDIRGTNPDAWTPWKETLLATLLTRLTSPENDQRQRFESLLKKHKWPECVAEEIDGYLLSALPARVLVEDLQRARGSAKQASQHVVQTNKQIWIRFFDPADRSGIFLNYVRWLTAAGLSIRHAAIQTVEELGVYDWFEVKSGRQPAQIMRLLDGAKARSEDLARKVKFDAIDLVSSSDNEWVISFRGQDQSGALLEAARALNNENLSIRWARVHTWGRQIDDVFAVSPPRDLDFKQLLERLQSTLN